MSKYNVLVVSDLHHGSIFGMLPPNFESSADSPITQNVGQRHLWQCWESLPSRIEHRLGKVKIHAMVVNGDPLDGKQRAQKGTELCLPIPKDQKTATIATIGYLHGKIGKPPLYFVQGTEYHDGRAGEFVEDVAETLGAERYKGLGTGRYSREVLDLEIDGVVINCAHGISVASGLYRATPPDREGVWSALAGKEGKMPKADCVVRSHAHFFIHVEHYSKHILITPCWELQTRYMRRNGPYRMVPDIGAVVIQVDPDAKREGLDPIDIHKILYPLPPIKTTRLAI